MNFTKSLLSAILVTTVSVSYAQDAAVDAGGEKLGYGGKIGVGLSNFSKEQFRVGSQIGGMIGGFVNYKVANFITPQLEVLYMQQGGKQMVSSSSSSDLIANEVSINRVTLHNVEIPLLARLTYPGLGGALGAFQPHLLVGPSLGLNFATTTFSKTLLEFNSGRQAVIKERETVASNDYKTLIWGAYLGAGIESKLKSYILTIDLRYRLGLNVINKNYDINTFVNGFGDIKSNTIALTVGVGF